MVTRQCVARICFGIIRGSAHPMGRLPGWAALLKVARAGHEALFNHHHSQPGATKAATAGTPGGGATTLAGTTSGGSLHDSEAV